jgi:hypothetical protein
VRRTIGLGARTVICGSSTESWLVLWAWTRSGSASMAMGASTSARLANTGMIDPDKA